MKLGFSSLGKTEASIEELIGLAVDHGYQGIELRGIEGEHISPQANAEERKTILSRFQDRNIEVLGITAYTTFALNDRKKRKENEETLLSYLELARDLKSPFVRTFLGKYQGDRLDFLPGIIESLNQVAERSKGEPVKILIETHDAWSRVDSIKEILDDTHESIGILWDMAHSVREGESLKESRAILGDRIGYLHMKDEQREGDKLIHCLPGRGVVPIKECCQMLESENFKGYYCLEWEKKWHPEMDELEIALPLFKDLVKQN